MVESSLDEWIGQSELAIHLALRDAPLDCESVERFSTHPDNGAQCVFRGIVRRDSDLSPVKSLDYDAYRKMALAQLGEIARTALARWPDSWIGIEHRLGNVPLGETSVIIAVGTPHRAESFDCCRFLIEELKHKVPIWKKEVGVSGNRWIEGAHADK